MNWYRRVSDRSAFSLVELIVVLLVMSAIASMVAVRWSGLFHKPMMDNAISNIEFTDSHLRQYALRHRKSCSLAIDLVKGQMQKRYGSASAKSSRWEPIARNVKVDAWTSSVHDLKGQIMEVHYGPDGTSATYGVQLSGIGKKPNF